MYTSVPFTSEKYKIDALSHASLALPHGFLMMEEAVFKDSVVFKGKGDAKLTEETLNISKNSLEHSSRPRGAFCHCTT
ncbi:hypothetical protein Tco_0115352 [Tanacetum coccineum]